MKIRREIDGLRAIAVLPVLFYHADIGFPGGYIGVDVFFVISGYLITSLILKDLDAGQFSIVEFWERRIRRILPALGVVLLATIAAGWFLFLANDFKDLGKSLVAQVMLMSNVYFWKESGYFAEPAEVKPLLHTWSLAVEEQFYLLFPFLLVAIKRYASKLLVPILMFIIAASFCLSVYGTTHHASATFYLLPMRAWELLTGAFLAAIPVTRVPANKWLREFLSWAGMLGILGAALLYTRDTKFPGLAALPPCIGTALIIWTNGNSLTSVGRLLSSGPLVFIGLISYSLYLWHWPVLVFFKYWVPDKLAMELRIALLLASVGLAALSWKFVETPFRKRAIFKKRAHIFEFAAVTLGLLLGAGLVVLRMQGVPSRIPAPVQQYADGSIDKAPIREISLGEARNGEFNELGIGERNSPVDLLVWGDSHAMAVMPAVEALCREHSVRALGATHSSTPPLIGYVCTGQYSLKNESIAFNEAIAEFIRRHHVSDVLLVADWGGYGSKTDADNTIPELHRGLLATISALKGSGTRIWVMKQVPEHRWNVPRALASTVFFGGDPEQVGLPLAEHRKVLQRHDPIFEGLAALDVSVLDPTELFVRNADMCQAAEGGKALYWDNQHLTIHGAMLLRPLFEPIFRRIGKNKSVPATGQTTAITERKL